MFILNKSFFITSLLLLTANSAPLVGAANNSGGNSNLTPKAQVNQIFDSLPFVGPAASGFIGAFTPILDSGPLFGTLLGSFMGNKAPNPLIGMGGFPGFGGGQSSGNGGSGNGGMLGSIPIAGPIVGGMASSFTPILGQIPLVGPMASSFLGGSQQ
ncbi:hypothetical protein CONCODRAFT_10281 [Conidiobolus coronatus NRRL 28638]|uniref:Uncharacterized protein n=1 Tax=Conidiobolus coronatus (strain ATCC 28846 / CBS 209.66 / NRRL 28638) TaxID=796925 RepID=A0A137NXN5_CONC2|nr:hypothetical protein CONCODRAFT_10281 [Conidiobolus coronatus NRRL 28638]|eukprot:KXN67623.1 hypothetical protein CONCODRAFT_10281 [Conidiobolus coronatus NRRL 28638]